jgi:hypothetical protein
MEGQVSSGGGDAPVRPWPTIFTQPRRALRAAADGRHWGPLLWLVLVTAASWLLRQDALADIDPAPAEDGQSLTESQRRALNLLGWVLVPVLTVLLPWFVGRLLGGCATVSEVCFIVLWSYVPWLAIGAPLELGAFAFYGGEDPRRGASLFEPATILALPPGPLALYLIGEIVSLWTLGLLAAIAGALLITARSVVGG